MFLRTAVVLIALAAMLLVARHAVAVESSAAAGDSHNARTLDEIKREYDAALLELGSPPEIWEEKNKVHGRAVLPHVWNLISEWAAAYLDSHPASADELAATLNSNFVKDPPGLRITAIQLANGTDPVYVVAIPASAAAEWSGTLVVLARGNTRRFRTLWTIADARGSLAGARRLRYWPRGTELGSWTELDPYPIEGSVHGLPRTRTGEVRFYVYGRPLGGNSNCQASQISIWEWNGERAVPILMETYGRTPDTAAPEFHGDTLIVHTTEPAKRLRTTCGDPRPEGLWKIRILPDRIDDQRPRLVDPFFDLFDTLFDRIGRNQDTSMLASEQVRDLIIERICEINRENHPSPKNCQDSGSGEWGMRPAPGKPPNFVEFGSDGLGDYTFDIENRKGKPYIRKAVRGSFAGILY